jgi:hypothetical protein
MSTFQIIRDAGIRCKRKGIPDRRAAYSGQHDVCIFVFIWSCYFCHLPPAIRYVSAAHVLSSADSKRSLPMYLLALGADRANVAAWTDLSVNAGKAGKHKLAQWAAMGNLAINPTADAHFLAANSYMYPLHHARLAACFVSGNCCSCACAGELGSWMMLFVTSGSVGTLGIPSTILYALSLACHFRHYFHFYSPSRHLHSV